MELGYERIFRPINDYGVDLIVETEKGRLAVQIKTAKVKSYGGRGPTMDLVADLGASQSKGQGRSRRLRGGARYLALGVDVFAVRADVGFYLIPAREIAGNCILNLRKSRAFLEAWDAALGAPLPIGAVPVAGLEQQFTLPWARSEEPPPPPSASPPGVGKGGA